MVTWALSSIRRLTGAGAGAAEAGAAEAAAGAGAGAKADQGRQRRFPHYSHSRLAGPASRADQSGQRRQTQRAARAEQEPYPISQRHPPSPPPPLCSPALPQQRRKKPMDCCIGKSVPRLSMPCHAIPWWPLWWPAARLACWPWTTIMDRQRQRRRPGQLLASARARPLTVVWAVLERTRQRVLEADGTPAAMAAGCADWVHCFSLFFSPSNVVLSSPQALVQHLHALAVPNPRLALSAEPALPACARKGSNTAAVRSPSGRCGNLPESTPAAVDVPPSCLPSAMAV